MTSIRFQLDDEAPAATTEEFMKFITLVIAGASYNLSPVNPVDIIIGAKNHVTLASKVIEFAGHSATIQRLHEYDDSTVLRIWPVNPDERPM